MADNVAAFEAAKAVASDYEAQLEAATTKDEALKHALAAAEKLVSAVKLTTDPAEKKALTKRFNVVADIAHNVKNNAWTPKPIAATQPQEHLTLPRPTSKVDGIGEWAADVSQSTGPVPNDSFSPTGSTIAVTHSGNSTSMAAMDGPTSYLPPAPSSHNGSNLLIAGSNSSRDTPQSQRATGTTNGLEIRPQRVIQTQHPPVEHYKASVSHVRQLREPISSRERTTREKIILLRASVVNGVRCPPWEKIPAAAEFALDESGLFTQSPDLSLSPQQQRYFKAWVRAEAAVPRGSTNSEDRPAMSSPRPIDLVQDAATDCSVVASLCAGIARTERGYDQILSTKLFPFDLNLGRPVVSSNGKYIVRLNFNGCWRRVTIDDRLPMSETRSLHVVDRRNPALLWPALLEKAYLTVRGGYDFPGSNSCSDLWTLTGWIPEEIHLQENEVVPDRLWHRLQKGFTFGDVLATLGTGQMTTKQERELGLEGQHSYVILDLKETDDDRLLLVKNPWVEGRGWLGPRPTLEQLSGMSDNSKDGMAVYHRDSIPTKDRPNPTTFWIGMEQVIRHFDGLYLNWNPGLFRYRQDIHFEWTVDGTSNEDNLCITTHPQFRFRTEDEGQVWFLLSRHFRDTENVTKEESDVFNDGSVRTNALAETSSNVPKGYMSLYVAPGDGNRLYIKDLVLERGPYVQTPQCLLRFDADAKDTYTIVLDEDALPASTYTFSLSAFSNSKLELEHAVKKYPLETVVSGEWTRQTAGGGTGSGEYFQNPQYALEVKESGPLAILLTSPSKKNALHVKVTLGHGKRIYRLNSRDIVADSGHHQVQCVFAETPTLEPGMYTIVCSLFEAGQTGDFKLRVDSFSKITLKQIPRDGAGLLLNRLANVCFRPETDEMVAPMVVQRLAAYTIVVRFLKATTSRSAGTLPATRSPLRFSVEYGRGPERKFLISSEGGQYSDAAVLRSEPVNLDPGMFGGATLSLVLDRLSGPGGPVEEWYEVELYTDAPNACKFGVWRDRK